MTGRIGRSGSAGESRTTAGVAEVVRRAAGYARAGSDAALAARLDALAVETGQGTPDLAMLDALFARAGDLHRASIAGGWEEKCLGLAAAYRVESAGLRDTA